MSERKIIQISVSSPAISQSPFSSRTINSALFALCDDGTVWGIGFDRKTGNPDQWEKLPGIPQA